VNGFSSGDLEAGAKYNLKGLYRAIVEPAVRKCCC